VCRVVGWGVDRHNCNLCRMGRRGARQRPLGSCLVWVSFMCCRDRRGEEGEVRGGNEGEWEGGRGRGDTAWEGILGRWEKKRKGKRKAHICWAMLKATTLFKIWPWGSLRQIIMIRWTGIRLHPLAARRDARLSPVDVRHCTLLYVSRCA
jgi:hypothetical protein